MAKFINSYKFKHNSRIHLLIMTKISTQMNKNYEVMTFYFNMQHDLQKCSTGQKSSAAPHFFIFWSQRANRQVQQSFYNHL